MKATLTTGLLLVFVILAGCETAPEHEGTTRSFDEAFYDFAWQRRPMVLFAPTKDDPRLLRQIEIMKKEKKGFGERDLTLVEAIGEDARIIFPNEEKLRTGSGSALRGRFGVEPTEFSVVVVGKDGNMRYQWSKPVDVETLFRAIE